MLAKLINNKLIYPTNPLIENGRWVLNPSDECLKELGYKEVIHNYLKDKQGYYQIVDKYVETNTITVYYKYEIEESIPELSQEDIEKIAIANKKKFLKDFIIIPYTIGDKKEIAIRKQTKIGSFLSLLSHISMSVQTKKVCPADTFIFYTVPNFCKHEEMKEEWLIANQINSPEMNLEEYNNFINILTIEFQKLFRGI